MVSHSHSPLFTPNHVFVGREVHIAAFESALLKEQTVDEYRVHSWYGVGGQGKSELREEFSRRLASREGIAHASLLFETREYRDPMRALLRLRSDLKRTGGIQFPAFDLAFARLYALKNPWRKIRNDFPELFHGGGSDVINDFIDLSETGIAEAVSEGGSAFIPGLNLAYKYAAKFRGRVRDWLESEAVKKKFSEFDNFSERELLSNLPMYLGFDLWIAITRENSPRITILIDAHERLWANDDGAQNLQNDKWIRRLISEAPGVLVLVFGREKLRWGEIDADWSSIVIEHKLEGLRKEEANEFLEALPIRDPAIRDRIVDAAYGAVDGCLPLHISLAAEQFTQTMNKGDAPSRDQFGTRGPEVLECFLKHLSEIERLSLNLVSYPEYLTEEIYNDLAVEFLGAFNSNFWREFTARSYVQEIDDGKYIIHALLRADLQSREANSSSIQFSRVHKFLFERLNRTLDVGENPKDLLNRHEIIFRETAHHAKHIDKDDAYKWFSDKFSVFHFGAKYGAIAKVCETLKTSFDKKSVEYYDFESNIAFNYIEDGQFESARAIYSRLEAVYLERYGKDGSRTLTVMHELARIFEHEKEYEKAINKYKAVYKLREKTKRDGARSAIFTANNIGKCYSYLEDHSQAIEWYEECLSIIARWFGDDNPFWAKTLDNLAQSKWALGATREAGEMVCASLEIRAKQLDSGHPDLSVAINNATLFQYGLPHDAECLDLHDRFVNAFKTYGGEGHPNYMSAIARKACCLFAIGNQTEAERLYDQSLCAVGSLQDENVKALVLSSIATEWAVAVTLHGDQASAEKLKNDAIRFATQAYGLDSSELAGIKAVLAKTVFEAGKGSLSS